MREWVIESLLQGAHLREYHLWEKTSVLWGDGQTKRADDAHARQKLYGIVKDALVRFSVKVPADPVAHFLRGIARLEHISCLPKAINNGTL
jgi:hypothetical protein